MSHFKYEIDERNLRMQLKAMEIPLSEEAWQKFENFSSTCKSGGNGDSAARRFHLSLNRNVVLPVVFGSVIILFSLLLFNFVNIKNPNPAREERAETRPQEAQATLPAPKKETPAPVKAAALPVAEEKENIPAQDLVNDQVPNNQITTPVKTQEPATATKAEKKMPAEVSAEIRITKIEEAGVTTASPTTQPEPRRKRLKKRTEVMTEPTAGEEEQAPPPVTDAGPSGE